MSLQPTNQPLPDPTIALQNAQQAFAAGNNSLAYYWASAATHAAPNWEEPWLILAAVSTPRDSLYYIDRALAINPSSQRALGGKQWAEERLAKASPAPQAAVAAASAPAKPKRSHTWIKVLAVIVVLGLLAIAAMAVAGFTLFNREPAAALPVVYQAAQARPQKVNFRANVMPANLQDLTTKSQTLNVASEADVPPTSTSVPAVAVVILTNTLVPAEPTALPPTATLEATPVPPQPTALPPEPTAVPEIPVVQITPVEAPAELPAEFAAPAAPQPVAGDGERWIDVNVSTQQLFAYEGNTLINSFTVSTGTWETPTVIGTYRVYIKYTSTDMRGPGYFLQDVPWTMYFYQGYGIHGTYWHNNFGTPMSHGCVNMAVPDANWLFNWASVGTIVNVHY